jgi:hypothetical protein
VQMQAHKLLNIYANYFVAYIPLCVCKFSIEKRIICIFFGLKSTAGKWWEKTNFHVM